LTRVGCRTENVFLVDDVDVEPPAIAVGVATAVFLLDHMSSEPDRDGQS
jgi:hypothetical protein